MTPELLEALRTLLKESLGDWIYDVRERTLGDSSFTGNSWDHPRVTAFSNAVQTITEVVALYEQGVEA